MKKFYLTLFIIFGFTLISFSQDCPSSIKTSGQSTTSTPIFTVPNGQNGCTGFPTTILVDGLTYNYVSCNGGNLEYELAPGQTPPDTFEAAVDFGTGTVCNYDANGDFTGETLSIVDVNSLSQAIQVYPNPVVASDYLFLSFKSKTNSHIKILDISGKILFKKDIFNKKREKINADFLTNGIYLIQIEVESSVITKKVIVMN